MSYTNKSFRTIFLWMLFYLPLVAAAQQKISGKVINSNDKTPVPGATVLVKGTNRAVQTGMNGKFSIEASQGNTIVVTGIGFENYEVSVGSTLEEINIALTQIPTVLDQVVVVGYGSQKKTKLTGAVSIVKMEDVLGERPVSSTASLLQGVAPGLQVTIGSGRPGEGANLNIRGGTGFGSSLTSSIQTGSPLILVDNTVFDGPLNLIDPADIETVTVLKDAGAAAIYGARSAFGVILITTKKGLKNQKAQFNYSNNIVFSNPVNLPEKASPVRSLQALIDGGLINYTIGQGQNLAKWQQLIGDYESNPAKYPGGYTFDNGIYYNLKGNNAVDELLGSSSMQFMNNFSVSGGSDKTTYRISLGATNEKGIMLPELDVDKYKRYNVKSVITTDVTSWMNVQLDANYSYAETIRPGYTDAYSYAVRIPSYLAGDTIPNYPGQVATGKNLVQNSWPTTFRDDQLRLTGRVILKPFEGMTITAENTFDNYHNLVTQYDKLFYLRDPYGWANMPYGNDLFRKTNVSKDYNSTNLYALYTKRFDRHNFSLMGGFNQEFKNYEQEILSKTQVINPAIPSISTSSGTFDGADNYSQFATRGYFGRLNYDYDGKYLLEVNGRYDGSSRFPDGHRWGFFPSASAGWRITNESFMQFIKPYVNELKLRASYGAVGNQNIGEYQFIASMNPTNPSWLNGGSRVVTVGAPGLISPDFTWEKVNTIDLGLTFGLFKNKLTGEFDWYTRETDGILSTDNTPVPAVLGTNPPLINSASLETKGFEIELNWKDKVGKVSYYVSANLFDYTSTVKNVNNPNKLISQLYVGQKMGEIWGYTSSRFYNESDFVPGSLNTSLRNGVLVSGTPKQVNQSPNPGDVLFEDLDKNGLINTGSNTIAVPGDRSVIGNNSLRYQFGIRGGVSYHNFDFSFVVSGVAKQDQFRNNRLFFPNNFQVYGALYQNQTDYWMPNNPDAYFGRIYTDVVNGSAQTFNEVVQTKYLLDGSYVRLRNVSLRYNLPGEVLKKLHVKNLSFNLSMENPAIFHHMPQGIYPDVSDLGGGLGYPFMRKTSIGINLNF